MPIDPLQADSLQAAPLTSVPDAPKIERSTSSLQGAQSARPGAEGRPAVARYGGHALDVLLRTAVLRPTIAQSSLPIRSARKLARHFNHQLSIHQHSSVE
jgi:hypothetical protein